jgi:protein-tyrosine-phosphatase
MSIRSGPVLIVCHGNICRSPYGAAALRAMLGGQAEHVVQSAGFIGPGRSSPAMARATAAARGVDIENHRSRLITPELLAEAALIVVMSPAQARLLRRTHGVSKERLLVLGDLDPLTSDTRGIRDPFGQPREVFDAVFGRIDRCLTVVARALTSG